MIKNSSTVVYQHIASANDLMNWTNQFAVRHGLAPVHDLTLFKGLIMQSVEYYLYANSNWAKNDGRGVEGLQVTLNERLGMIQPLLIREYYQKIFDRVIATMEEVLGSVIQTGPYDMWDIKSYDKLGVIKITYEGDYRIHFYNKNKDKLVQAGLTYV